MFEKLEAVEKRYEELTKIISDPEGMAKSYERTCKYGRDCSKV